MNLTVLVVRVLVMTWLLFLTGALLVSGYWWLAPLSGAGVAGHMWYLVRGQQRCRGRHA